MITAQNITKNHPNGHAPVLRDVSVEIDAGALFALYGHPGAGKTTLLKLLGLQDQPDSGVIAVDGVQPARLGGRALREVRRQFATVDFVLRPERTVAGNIATPLEQLGIDGPRRRDKVAQLLDLIALTRAGAAHPGSFNEGQRRRVAIARALAVDPAVLLVDDPVAGLDAEEAAGVLATLDRARAELGITVVVATSDADVVRKVCDGVAVLANGRVVESGTVLSLLNDQTSHTAQTLLPELAPLPAGHDGAFDEVADVVLVGHSTVDSLIPAAAERVSVAITTIEGGATRIADIPVARYRIGVTGAGADIALGWIAEHGGQVQTVRRASRVAAVSELVPSGRGRSLAGVAA